MYFTQLSKFDVSELEDYISHAERLSLEIQKLTEKEETEEERLQRQEIIHLFETVDSYMEGQADLQKKAYELLIEKDTPPVNMDHLCNISRTKSKST